MSADRRRKILIGFGAVAVVLVAAIALVSPKFKNEDAIGAIGAVQKHRAPQIAQKDVILGDEQTRKHQQLLFSDYLADAATLQNESAAVNSMSKVEAVSRLAATSSDLRARYVAAAKDQLAGMKALLARDTLGMNKLESLEADVNAAASRNLAGNEDIGALNARLNSEFAALEASLQTRNLRSVEADVAGLASRVDSRASLDAARSTLAQATQALDARSNTASMIQARASYLDSTAKECRALASAEEALSAGSRTQSASLLSAESHDLAQRALVNMRSSLDSSMETADTLGQMKASLDAVSKAVESRANMYSAASLASFRQEASAFARQAESRATEAQSRATAEMRGQLNQISSYLGVMNSMGVRADSRSNLAAFQAQLGSINQAAQSRAMYASVLSESALGSYSTLKSRNQ